jgi:hypothetical protein
MSHFPASSLPEPIPSAGLEFSSQNTWWWGLIDASGEVAGVHPDYVKRFASQADAESWVGEFWADLASMGVDSVLLMDGEREVYGPMSLQP